MNPHLHALVLDGVFAKADTGGVAFHPAPPITDLDVAEVLATLEPRIARLLDRWGRGDHDDAAGDPLGEEAPVLACLAAAVQGRVALGRTRRARQSSWGSR